MALKKLLIILFFPIIGFLLSLYTLPDYGTNWDTYQHLARGQSYFRFISQGKENSKDLPNPCFLKPEEYKTGKGRECPLSILPRISLYEKTVLDVNWASKMTIGHPPLMDIILAASNNLFYKNLGIVSDVSSYHLLLVLIAFLFALLIAFWANQTIGLFGSIISVLSLYTIPIFFSEQHFNLKDPTVSFFITACAYTLFQSIHKKRFFWYIVSGISAGFALGIKFNILFLFFPVLLWLPFALKGWTKTKIFKIIPNLALVAIISWIIFYISYPAIWNKPISGTVNVLRYYSEISQTSLNPCYYPLFTPGWFGCSSTLAILLFLSTIPIITLLLAVYGSIYSLKNAFKLNAVYLFWFLLMIFPVVRSTLPIVQLYGGSLRQILEFIGPLSLLAGLGANSVVNLIKNRSKKRILQLLITVLFLPILLKLIELHPNQNLFFNSFVGGINGAKKLGLPEVGNTYGNAYKQLTNELNKIAEPYSKLITLVSIGSSFPPYYIRPDIDYLADGLDITKHQGEYILELTVPGMEINKYFRYRYANRLLNPIYEIKVDNIVIGKIWHNTYSNLYEWAKTTSKLKPKVEILNAKTIELSLPNSSKLKQLYMYSKDEQCLKTLTTGNVLILNENNTWERFTEGISFFEPWTNDLKQERLFLFAGDVAARIKIIVKTNNCNLKLIDFEFMVFGNQEGDQ